MGPAHGWLRWIVRALDGREVAPLTLVLLPSGPLSHLRISHDLLSGLSLCMFKEISEQVQLLAYFGWNVRRIGERDQAVQFALSEQHGMSQTLRQPAKELFCEITQLQSLSLRVPNQ